MRFIISTLTLVFGVWAFTASADDHCTGKVESPCVVQDTVGNSSTVKHWRDSKTIVEVLGKGTPVTKGLEQLWLSGSGAPSAAGLAEIAARARKDSNGQALTIFDVDLRQESHGYLNNDEINLTSENDWINKGKTREKAMESEATWLNELKKKKLVENVLEPKQFKAGIFHGGRKVSVESVRSEEEVAGDAKMKYVRLAVTDHTAPDAVEVDRFVDFVRNLPEKSWVHVHCRGGDGRTTTFMAMFDMLHNAGDVPLETIIKRQAGVDPFYDLFKTSRKKPEFTELYQQRAEFIKKFYDYASAYRKGLKKSWSQWKNKNAL